MILKNARTRSFKTIIRDIDSIDYDLADDVIERFRTKCKASKSTKESNRLASSECQYIALFLK